MNKYTLLGLLIVFSCKSVKYTAAALPDKQVIVGESGGFAGTETNYILCASGQVFKMTFPVNKTEEISGLDTHKIKDLFQTAWKKDWEKYSYAKSGNLTQMISIKNGNNLNKISWASNDTMISKDLKSYYQEFHKILQLKSKSK